MQDKTFFYLDMEPGFNLVNEQTSLKGGVSKKCNYRRNYYPLYSVDVSSIETKANMMTPGT